TSSTVSASMRVDGHARSSSGAELEAGAHDVVIGATITGTGWALAPLWNDADLFTTIPSTVSPPSAVDRALRPWTSWIAMMLVLALVVMGIASLWQQIGDWRIAAWVGGSIAAGAFV